MRNGRREIPRLPRLAKSAALIAAAIPLGLLTSCGSESGTLPENHTAAETGGSAGGGADATGSGAARLPDDFPADFPLPSSLQIVQGTFTEGSATTQANYLVRGTSAMSVAELADFYRERLPEAGYNVQQSPPPSAEASSALVYFQGDRVKDGSVQLNSSDGATEVLISLPLRD